MRKSMRKDQYTETNLLLDMYGLSPADDPRNAIASNRPEDLHSFRARQRELLDEMITCDDREDQ